MFGEFAELAGPIPGIAQRAVNEDHRHALMTFNGEWSYPCSKRLAEDHDAAIGIFVDYVFNDPHAWAKMPQSARDETLRDAHEGM